MTPKKIGWGDCAVVLIVATLFGLGGWQLQRLTWKQDLLGTMEARRLAPVVDLADLAEDWATAEFRRVRISGALGGVRRLKLMSRVRLGEVGVHIVAPVQLDDGGAHVFADLGWAPTDWVQPQYFAPPQVNFIAVVRAFGPKPSMRPPSNMAAGELFWMDGVAIIQGAGVAPVLPIYVVALPGASTEPGILPDGAFPVLTNHHLQYALTWFALAFGLIAIYITMLIKRR